MDNETTSSVNSEQLIVNSQKPIRWAAIFLTVILISVVAVGAYWLGTKKAVTRAIIAQPTPIPTRVTAATPTPVPTIDRMASWKSYSDSKYGYTIRYPENLTIKQTNYTGSLASVTLFFDQKNVGSFIPNVTIYVDANWNGKSNAKNAVKNSVVDNVPAFRESNSGQQELPFEKVYFEKNGVVFVISLSWDGKDKSILEIFDQILATFKFTP